MQEIDKNVLLKAQGPVKMVLSDLYNAVCMLSVRAYNMKVISFVILYNNHKGRFFYHNTNLEQCILHHGEISFQLLVEL